MAPLFQDLTRRANQRHIFIIANIVKLAPAESAAGFLVGVDAIRGEVSNYPTCCIAFSAICRRREKRLSRRANHRQAIIIAKIVMSPGGEIRRGFFVAIFESDGGRM